MKSLISTPARRIGLALALSALIHALVLWLPHVTLPRFEPPLPELTAKLVEIPKLPPKRAPKKPKAKPPRPAPPAPAPEPAPPPAVAAASSVVAEPIAVSSVADVPPADAAAAASSPAPTTEPAKQVPLLPKHARLRFVAYLGTGGLYVGEMRHELEIADGRYTLRAELQTTGLASLFKHYELTQQSTGMLLPSGSLQPQDFSEDKTDSKGTLHAEAHFDWAAQQLNFSHGGKAQLSAEAQDILSFLYQLSQLSFERAIIPLAISNGKKLEEYQLEVIGEEVIDTPLGKLRTLRLSKVHGPNEEGLEVWLGLEYRLLPVKFRQIERSGDIAGELAIRQILVKDE